MPFPTTGVLDDFNRADGDITTGSNWVVFPLFNANLDIISNQVGSSAGGTDGNIYNTSYGPDVEVYTTVKVVPPAGDAVELWFRITNSTVGNETMYLAQFSMVTGSNNDTAALHKFVNGSFTGDIGGAISLGVDYATDDVLGIRMVGDTVTFYRNGTSIGTRTDSSISAAGLLGLSMPSSDASGRVDDFGGGTFVAATSTPRIFGAGTGRVFID